MSKRVRFLGEIPNMVRGDNGMQIPMGVKQIVIDVPLDDLYFGNIKNDEQEYFAEMKTTGRGWTISKSTYEWLQSLTEGVLESPDLPEDEVPSL